MKNGTKKAFGQMFKVMCDTSTYHPNDGTWESLIARTKNGGWHNPSGIFKSSGKSPDVEGTIVGFYIPSSIQKNHPKFAFIKGRKGRFAIKFG